jgi:hypothetical protein
MSAAGVTDGADSVMVRTRWAAPLLAFVPLVAMLLVFGVTSTGSDVAEYLVPALIFAGLLVLIRRVGIRASPTGLQIRGRTTRTLPWADVTGFDLEHLPRATQALVVQTRSGERIRVGLSAYVARRGPDLLADLIAARARFA